MNWKEIYDRMTPDQRDTLRGALAFADEYATQRLRDKFHQVWEEIDPPENTVFPRPPRAVAKIGEAKLRYRADGER